MRPLRITPTPTAWLSQYPTRRHSGSLGRNNTRGRLFEDFSRTPSPNTARARAKESGKKEQVTQERSCVASGGMVLVALITMITMMVRVSVLGALITSSLVQGRKVKVVVSVLLYIVLPWSGQASSRPL